MPALTDVSLFLGFVMAWGLAPAIGILALNIPTNRRLRVITVSVAVLTFLLWVAQMLVWRQSFDEPIPGETVPNELWPVSDALTHACGVGCLVLLTLAAVILTGHVRRRSLDPEARGIA